ncbi:MAG: hypothetical protein JNM63_20125 [Spirochaetia bacterium]|nr:hypothetical protein [Spirochaetia bacterium]
MKTAFAAFSAFFILANAGFAADTAPKLETNSAAYLTYKSLVLEKHIRVVGVNRRLLVQMENAGGGQQRVRVEMPIRAFDSGAQGREDYVANALGAKVQSNLIFLSKPRSAGEWKALFQEPKFSIAGELTIAGKNSTLAFDCKPGLTGDSFTAVHVGSYGAFGLEIPMVGPGGMIGKAENYLELHAAISLKSLFP